MEKTVTIKVLKANLVDIPARSIYPAKITVNDGKTTSIEKIDETCEGYVLPGFVDAHIHIESSMLPPAEFARLATLHGTVATVSDPHEIANVLGVEGIEFMIQNARQSGFKTYFGASSCVPATAFETSGAALESDVVDVLLERDDIYYLSEMMNFPGVLENDGEVMAKIKSAQMHGKPVDGHAPALRGEALSRYISAGITTDHEAFSFEEAKEKLEKGMKIQIREGSAAKNFEALHPLIDTYYQDLMFCSDDKHPDDLLCSHINALVVRALKHGHDLFKVLQIACINPVEHYGLDVGQLRVGDSADFVVVEDLQAFRVIQTVINGNVVADSTGSHLPHGKWATPNRFAISPKPPQAFIHKAACNTYHVIEAVDHELITHDTLAKLKIKAGQAQPDIAQDILHICVVNRYEYAPISFAYIRGFGLESGAIASSVAHDSHNIIAVGCDTQSLRRAVNAVIETKGGICATDGKETLLHLPLPIAGLMSDADGFEVARGYGELDKFVKEKLGSTLDAPFMTLSFMALLVIPELKLSDKGLFDGRAFHFIGECEV